MVRVSHPPGGQESHLSTSPKRELKGVRVLKPPGGGSSISFDDSEDFYNRAPKPAAPMKQQSEDSPKKVVNSPPSPAKPSETEAKSPEKTSPAPESGMANGKDHSPTTNGTSSQSGTDLNGSQNGVSTPVETPTLPVKKVEVAASPAKISETPAKTTEAVIAAPKETISPKIADLPSLPSPKITNGSSSDSTPSVTSPSSPVTKDCAWPTPEGLPSKSPDTKHRLFGAPNSPVVTPTNTPTRPVLDRMKSSIFSYEAEGFPSPKTCSPVFAPESKPSPVQPAAAPRQRVPPGGFSTKLW